MKTLLTTILTTVFLLVTTVPAFAVTQSEIDNTLTNLEDQRIQKLEEQLGLTLPTISDNPNHIITFRDPSGEVGVKLEIDGQGFKAVKSPYTLPSLGIGKHILTFKFTDKEETEQTLEKNITIIPRPAVIEAPEKLSLTELTFKGTALATSTVDLHMVSGTKQYKGAVDVGSDGTWTYTFNQDFEYGIYNIVGVTRKNGFASNFSETIVFELSKSGEGAVKVAKVNPIHFSFTDLIKQNPTDIVKQNPDLLYLTGGTLLLGLLIALMFARLGHIKMHKNLENVFSNKLNGKTEDKKDLESTALTKPLTLREKFEKAGLKKEEIKEIEKQVDEKIEEREEKNEDDMQEKGEDMGDVDKEIDTKEEENKKEEKKKDIKEEKVISKKEFLEEFKDHDPDTKKGEEKKESTVQPKPKKSSNLMNSIKISLTSKPKK